MSADNFTDIDGTPLATHDSNWVQTLTFLDISDCVIRNNAASPLAAWATFSAHYSTSNEDTCQVVLRGAPVLASYIARFSGVRAGVEQRGYEIRLAGTADGYYGVYLYKSGAWLGTLTITGYWDTTLDHTVKITVVGTTEVTIEGFVDGVSQGTIVDAATPLGPGSPSILCDGAGDLVSTVFDDWTDGSSSNFIPAFASNCTIMVNT